MLIVLAIVIAISGLLYLATNSARRTGATTADLLKQLPGDDIIGEVGYISDHATSIDASTADVWPWLVQLGKQRAGWYAPEWLERLMARKRRLQQTRQVKAEYQSLKVGDVIPDWAPGSLRVVQIEPQHCLVYVSIKQPKQRENYGFSWVHVLEPISDDRCRIHTRLRLRRPSRRWQRALLLFLPVAGFFDYLVITALYAGLKERIEKQ